MKITLRLDGKDKTFTQEFVPGRVFRRAIEIARKVDFSAIDVDTLDSLVDFVSEAFGKQFSVDQFYDGIDARKMIGTIMDSVNAIVSDASEAMGVDPNDPNSQRRT